MPQKAFERHAFNARKSDTSTFRIAVASHHHIDDGKDHRNRNQLNKVKMEFIDAAGDDAPFTAHKSLKADAGNIHRIHGKIVNHGTDRPPLRRMMKSCRIQKLGSRYTGI